MSQDTELRRNVRATGSKYKVVKNTLAQRASKGHGGGAIARTSSPAGAQSLYNEKDPGSSGEGSYAYAKNNPLFVFKAGMVEGRVVDLADLEQIANFPSKEELISKLMFLLNAQAQRLASAVSGRVLGIWPLSWIRRRSRRSFRVIDHIPLCYVNH